MMFNSKSCEAFCHVRSVIPRESIKYSEKHKRKYNNTAKDHEERKTDFPLLFVEGPRK